LVHVSITCRNSPQFKETHITPANQGNHYYEVS